MTLKSALYSTALLAALSSNALAQTAPVQEDEIIVTGQYLYADTVNALKTPTPIINVPQSLSIFTAEQITDQGFTSIGDIINYTPGVNTSQGEGHRDSIVIRGVRSTADFYIDGMRDDVQYYRPLYNLEQVEVLRGPNALLFGRGGTGGIINRVSKKGVIGETFTGYKASIDTFGEHDIQIDTNFETSDSSALRVNAFYEGLNNHRDFYDGTRFGINPTFKAQLNPNTVLNLSYEYADHDRFIDRGIPADNSANGNHEPVEALKDVVFGDPDLNVNKLQAHLLRANLSHQFSDTLKANINAFYGDYDKLYQNFYAAGYDPASNIVTLDGYRDPTQRQNLILSGDVVGEFSTGTIKHNILVGAEYINTNSDNARYDTFFDTTMSDRETFLAVRPLGLVNGTGTNAEGNITNNDFSVDLNRSTEVKLNVFSAYIQDEIDLTENFKAVVGARFDNFDIDVFNVKTNETRTRTDDEISPRLGLIYKPKENVSLYAGYSKSFLPRSGEQFKNINGDNDALDPNTYKNLEAGVKWDIDDRISLTAAIFEAEESSPQPSDDDASTLDVIDSKTKGFELQIMGQLSENWFVNGGYSYLDGNQVNNLGVEGNRKRELPKNMFSLWNNYQVNDQFGIGLGVTHQGEYFATNSGADSTTVPGYTRFDAAAYYDLREDLRLQVNIENLTDTTYYPNSHSTHQVSVGAPLNARFTVSGRF